MLASLTVITGGSWALYFSTSAPRTFNVRHVIPLTKVHAGDRIAQLIVEKIAMPDIEEVEV